MKTIRFPTVRPSDGFVPLESVLCTEELNRRPRRPPDHETENRALLALAQALADSPGTILQKMAEIMLVTCRAHSAGFSLLSEDGKRFHWPAIAGEWKSQIGGGTPRDFGPCGDVLDCDAPLLFTHPERRYLYLTPVVPAMVECLSVPFHMSGSAVGTIWAVLHEDPTKPERRRFDAEDLRLLVSLGRYASAAYQAMALLQRVEQRDAALEESHVELAQRVVELERANVAAPARRAALNLLEDAVQARQAMEKLNAELRESKERLARELTSTRQLQSVSALLIEGGDTDALYHKIVDAAVALMHSDGASMQVLDERQDALRMLAFQGFDPAFGKVFELNRPDREVSCSVARRLGHRVVVPDVESCEFMVGTPALEDHRKTGIRAVQSTPLVSRGGRLLGMISTHWRTPHMPPESDLRAFDILARQAADLLERKRAEDAIRQSEALFFAAVDQAPTGMYVVDSRFRVQQVNSRALPVFDAVHPLIGRDFAEIIEIPWGPEVGGEMARIFRHTLETGERYISPGFFERRHDLGVEESYEWEAQRMTLPSGEHAVVCYFTDITERKRAEGALRESEARLRFMADSMPQKIFTAKPNGEDDYRNQQWMEFSGLSFETMKDWGWTRLIHPDDVAETVRSWRRCIDTGDPFQIEHRCRRADGEYRWHLTRARAMRDPQGKVGMWIGSSTDVHEVKEADRRKDEFLAMLAHELRNPLAPVIHAAQLLRQPNLEARGSQRAVEIITRQAARMARLIDDLLDVSRITRGIVELRRQRVDLRPALEAAIETNEARMAEKSQKFQGPALPDPIWLDADSVRLEQVISNLLNNAVKYTPEGGRIELSVELEREWVVARIRDTGIGIGADMLPRIFDLFSQEKIGNSTDGLGIGLTVVRSLVELHGGNVVAHSAGRGQGSEFVVRFPVLREAAGVAAGSEQAPSASELPSRSGAFRRILLVEDNADAAETLTALLESWGHEVSTVANGPAALDAVGAVRPDVILLDVGLPGMSGYEVARKLRRQPFQARTRIIAMTGYGQEEDRLRSREAGFDEHLVKPVSPDTLREVLARRDRE